jgi:membrane protein YdbS with pleckstrin-like domain
MRGLMFYAKAPGYAFQRNQYTLMILAPLLSISVLMFLGILLLASTSLVWVLALWAIVNASAANVDIWITALVLRYPKSAYVVDEQDGMRILLPESNAMAE